MKYRVAIIGAGQLGSRYLQGMVHCKLPLHIMVIDPSNESLVRAQDRWNEVSAIRNVHFVEFLKSYKDLLCYVLRKWKTIPNLIIVE